MTFPHKKLHLLLIITTLVSQIWPIQAKQIQNHLGQIKNTFIKHSHNKYKVILALRNSNISNRY